MGFGENSVTSQAIESGIQRDFVELTEDVSSSPLWNKDLAPTTIAQRTWSTWNIAALWIGMSVVITTYTLASGLMQQGMTWWQAMLTILLGLSIIKAALIVAYFMHLRFERLSLVLTLVPILVVCICLLMVFFPDSFRSKNNRYRFESSTQTEAAEEP